MIYLICVTGAGVLAADYGYTVLFVKAAADAEPEIEAAYRIPNPDFEYGFKPNFAGLASWGGIRYHFATNSLGFRDASPRNVPKHPGKPRIVFIGDSFAEGTGLEWHDTFIGKVASAKPDFDILNAGVGSYSPSVYYKKFKWLVESGYRVDLVWVFIDISDIQDEVRRSDTVNIVALPKRIDVARTPVDPVEGAAKLFLIKKFFQDNFHATFTGLQASRALLAHAYASLGGDPSKLRARPWWIGLPRAEWTIHIDEAVFAPIGFQKALDRAIESMNQLYKIATKNGIPLFVSVYPWPHQIYHNDRNSRQVEIWRTWCEMKCARFVDFFPALFDAAKEAGPFWYERLFLDQDVHFTRHGNEVLARGVLRHLEDEYSKQGRSIGN